jgi:hypothetical protein
MIQPGNVYGVQASPFIPRCTSELSIVKWVCESMMYVAEATEYYITIVLFVLALHMHIRTSVSSSP